MSAHMHRALALALLVTLTAATAWAQQPAPPAPTAAPIPPATSVQQKPASPPTEAPLPAAPSAQQKPKPSTAVPPPATPRAATPAQPATPATPATLAPLPATSLRSINYRIEVQVTERQDGKVVTSETFTALVSNYSNSRISRVTPPTTASLEVAAQEQAGDTVRLKLVAQFKLASGVDIGQEVTSFMTLGKPSTLIDIASGAEGARRFVVQATVVRAPLE